jgi:hypothetical protein
MPLILPTLPILLTLIILIILLMLLRILQECLGNASAIPQGNLRNASGIPEEICPWRDPQERHTGGMGDSS